VKNEAITSTTVLTAVPIKIAPMACAPTYLRTALYSPKLINTNKLTGSTKERINQLFNSKKGDMLSSRTINANQKALKIKVESINNVRRRFFERDELRRDWNQLSTVNP